MIERRNLPDMKMLQTFEAAARHGNFTRAAEELALTQSAVSRQIRDLEAQIGFGLFERVPGRVVTTQEGRRFLHEVERLLAMAETTMRHARAGPPDHQILAINALPTFAERWLLPRLDGYLATHPQTRFDITTRRGIFDFTTTQCDLAIHYGQPLWPGAVCTYLCSEIVLPVAGGALRKGGHVTVGDLASAPKLHVSERPSLWADWFATMGSDEKPQNGHWFDQFSLTIEAAKAGLGYALLPRYLIEAELASGELTVVLEAPHSTDQGYYIVTPEGRSQAVETFRDWLLSQVSFRPLARDGQSSIIG
ncbi:LysR family transcriptional regulator [Thioclava kandeliae]|uniref:LysR family transcriptional regulator n=1 Tax=Thioclava kandeliae TaxID=3070818 RepID=A0ABV1SHN4_9RHOB